MSRKGKQLKTRAPAVGQVWRYMNEAEGSVGPCYRIECASETVVVCTPGLWNGSGLEPLANWEQKTVPLFDLGRIYEYMGDEGGVKQPDPMLMLTPFQLEAKHLERIAVALEKIEGHLKEMSLPSLHEVVERSLGMGRDGE